MQPFTQGLASSSWPPLPSPPLVAGSYQQATRCFKNSRSFSLPLVRLLASFPCHRELRVLTYSPTYPQILLSNEWMKLSVCSTFVQSDVWLESGPSAGPCQGQAWFGLAASRASSFTSPEVEAGSYLGIHTVPPHDFHHPPWPLSEGGWRVPICTARPLHSR